MAINIFKIFKKILEISYKNGPVNKDISFLDTILDQWWLKVKCKILEYDKT